MKKTENNQDIHFSFGSSYDQICFESDMSILEQSVKLEQKEAALIKLHNQIKDTKAKIEQNTKQINENKQLQSDVESNPIFSQLLDEIIPPNDDLENSGD